MKTGYKRTERNRKAADITAWDEFDEEDEFELTHVETCMGPVTKDYSFSFEWED